MITLKNVVLRRGAKVILDSASVNINPGEKVGLVGRNGAGKSTLFALLNGTIHEDGGDYSIPTQWAMAQVAQDMPETDQNATRFVVEGDIVLLAAQTEVEASESSGDGDRMAHAYMALYDAGAHDATRHVRQTEARSRAMLLERLIVTSRRRARSGMGVVSSCRAARAADPATSRATTPVADRGAGA